MNYAKDNFAMHKFYLPNKLNRCISINVMTLIQYDNKQCLFIVVDNKQRTVE